MTFYLIMILLSYLQSSVMLSVFSHGLVVPDLVLCIYFLELLKKEDRWGIKAIFSGAFLDILQDSAGLYLSRQMIFCILYELMSTKLQFPTKISKVIAYLSISIVTKLFAIILFSTKHKWELNSVEFLAGILIEALFIYRFCK
ncbi:MAG: hypothetical protein ABDH18_04150 [Aquificaceae bacterium]